MRDTLRVFGDLPRIFGQYIVLAQLGAGGMAKVYRAKRTDARIRKLVAIKRLRASAIGDERFTRMFIDEARLAAQLVHPNIVQTYELGRDEACLYIVMEHVWGETTGQLIAAARTQAVTIPLNVACSIVLSAAEALDFAHRAVSLNGIPLDLVHRDVSPQNMLISYEGEVKLIDFGIAKSAVAKHATEPGTIKGKPRYMAPEQITGGKVDARTDVFGLGLVLYELLKGEQAFDGSNPMIIFEQILNREPKELPDSVPTELRHLVARCLAKDPQRRFQSVAALMDALAPFVIDERGLVGRKHRQALMTTLFATEIEQVRTLNQAYAQVTLEQCVNAVPVDRTAPTQLKAPPTAPHVARTVIAAVPIERRGKPRDATAAMAISAAASVIFWVWMVARIVTTVVIP
jgi:serine/threonine protein kinase